MAPKKMKPDIALEFKDVSIEIKVCGVDLMPEDREYVKFFPEIDNNLTCRDKVDDFRRINNERKKRERKKVTRFEYKLVPNHAPAAKETVVKVLPKLNCEQCGKTFSRRSTLEQHMTIHDEHNSSWEEVQDAALHDLEQAIIFPGMVVGKGGGQVYLGRREHSVARKEITAHDSESEEQEVEPPKHPSIIRREMTGLSLAQYQKQFMASAAGKTGTGKLYKCGKCEAHYTDIGNLKRHIWAKHKNPNRNQNGTFSKQTGSSSDIKLETEQIPIIAGDGTVVSCPYCKRKFAARAHLDRHLPVHNNMVKPFVCDICGWKFHLLHNMERHKSTHDKGRKAKVPPHLRDNQHSEDSINQAKEKDDQIKDTKSNLDPENKDATNAMPKTDESIADDSNLADVNKDKTETVNKSEDSTSQEVNESNVAADSGQDTSATVNKTDRNIELDNNGQSNDNNDNESELNDAEEEIELDDIDFDQSDSEDNEVKTENSDARLISEKME